MSELTIGDLVETIKGARFWGVIISIEYDDPAKPGATVKAIAPGFEGTKHVYPLSQLRRRVSPLSDGDGWQLVPSEPNEAMIQAGIEALRTEGYTPIDRDPLFVWRAMLHEARALSGNRSGN